MLLLFFQKEKKMKTKLAGYCGVDSGQIMVIDPCYAFKDSYTGNDSAVTGGNYDAICRVSIADTFGGFPLPANGYSGNIGVVTSSGYGDGCYPVFVDVNEDGRVVELRIAFDGIKHDDLQVLQNAEEEEGLI
jgi:hypothetical protein